MLADALNSSPFAVLTFIAAPAILTNASSVLTLSTGNRFARAIDRARLLAAAIAAQAPDGSAPAGGAAGGQPWFSEDVRLLVRQLDLAERRVLIIIRALTAFSFAMGSFALGTLTSLAGASLSVLGYTGSTHHVVLVVAVVAGGVRRRRIGVGGRRCSCGSRA